MRLIPTIDDDRIDIAVDELSKFLNNKSRSGSTLEAPWSMENSRKSQKKKERSHPIANSSSSVFARL
jgi:hypothetical protein